MIFILYTGSLLGFPKPSLLRLSAVTVHFIQLSLREPGVPLGPKLAWRMHKLHVSIWAGSVRTSSVWRWWWRNITMRWHPTIKKILKSMGQLRKLSVQDAFHWQTLWPRISPARSVWTSLKIRCRRHVDIASATIAWRLFYGTWYSQTGTAVVYPAKLQIYVLNFFYILCSVNSFRIYFIYFLLPATSLAYDKYSQMNSTLLLIAKFPVRSDWWFPRLNICRFRS